MSIRWLRNVIISDQKSTVEIQMGSHSIGDKCYVRINNEMEQWFDNISDDRADIIAQGVDILKKKLKGKTITNPDGTPYDWQ